MNLTVRGMSRNYKNILRKPKAYGVDRRKDIAKEILSDSTPIPKALDYKDIDSAFKDWVENVLKMDFEGKRLPTIVLFSNQRFSEYMQSWQNVDNKRNMMMNFKAVSRENNPKTGTINGQTRNIPGERTYLMKRVVAHDENNREYYIDYRVKQPFAIDLIYSVSLVTNKYSLLNEFNQLVNERFKAINDYLFVNGHYMAMRLNNITDESEYSIDNRQFYSQTYNITVMAYIMPADSFVVEETPKLKFMGFEGDQKSKSYADVEELPCGYFEESPYQYQPMRIIVHVDSCATSYKFRIDCDFKFERMENDNIRGFNILVNDKVMAVNGDLRLKENDEVNIRGIARYDFSKPSEIVIYGYDTSKTVSVGSVSNEENIIVG